MASDTVTAIWVGPYDAELPNLAVVHVGETAEVPREFAEESSHWQVVSASPVATRTAPVTGGDA